MTHEILEKFAQSIRDGGYACVLMPLSDGRTEQGLVVELQEGQNWQVIAYYLSDLVQVSTEMSQGRTFEGLGNQRDFFQLFLRFPFQVENQAFADLARLLMRLNWAVPVGTFGIQEKHRLVYYRQVIGQLAEPIDAQLVTQTLHHMRHFAGLYVGYIQRVATGEVSLDGLLQELEAAGTKNKVFPDYD
jgi:hypothetical protein